LTEAFVTSPGVRLLKRLIRGLLAGLLSLLIVVAPSHAAGSLAHAAAETTGRAAIPPTGQAVDSLAAYDKAMLQVMEKWSLPGGALAVVKDGRLVLARGYGLADRDASLPVQPDSLFRVASLSKPITSAAVLQLVERGQLDLDAPAFKILEDLQPGGSTVDPRIWQITVRHLLHHTAGWERITGDKAVFAPSVVFAERSFGAPLPVSCESVISFIFTQPLDFDPGTKFDYSNLGYCILGRVIERVSRQPYIQYVSDNVLKPVGANRMQIGGSTPAEHVAGEVNYYDYPGAPLITLEVAGAPTTVPIPDGGMYLPRLDAFGGWIASTVDYARFTASLMGQRQPAVLQPKTMAMLSARPAPPVAVGEPAFYGLGWMVRPQPAGTTMWHFGGLPGSSSQVVVQGQNVIYLAFFNSYPAPDGQLAMLGDLDRSLFLATNAVVIANGWPDHDLFGEYP
jgi:N-acyl-D-amino-acid deacylase